MARVDDLVAAAFDDAYLDRADAYETYESRR